jgi:hypothetical protein
MPSWHFYSLLAEIVGVRAAHESRVNVKESQ